MTTGCTAWFRPAFATGGEFRLEMITIAGGLLCPRVSVTTSRIRYSPGRSAVNIGVTAAGSDSAAALPGGLDRKDQKYVSRSPSGSDEPPPSRVTTAGGCTV